MARFQPACLKEIGKYHRFVIDIQKEIEQIIRDPQPIHLNFDFDALTIRFLRLRLRDNIRTLEALHSY